MSGPECPEIDGSYGFDSNPNGEGIQHSPAGFRRKAPEKNGQGKQRQKIKSKKERKEDSNSIAMKCNSNNINNNAVQRAKMCTIKTDYDTDMLLNTGAAVNMTLTKKISSKMCTVYRSSWKPSSELRSAECQTSQDHMVLPATRHW